MCSASSPRLFQSFSSQIEEAERDFNTEPLSFKLNCSPQTEHLKTPSGTDVSFSRPNLAPLPFLPYPHNTIQLDDEAAEKILLTLSQADQESGPDIILARPKHLQESR